MIDMLVANGNLLTLHATGGHIVGVCKRLCVLIDTVDELSRATSATRATTFREGDGIGFEGVQVHTPTGHHLVKDLSFKIDRGTNLLLTGHNGAGKSSIFRCLGGLWSVEEGVITKPGSGSEGLHQDIFYLPQKPYNVLGSLRDQITYPASARTAQLHEERLRELLALVGPVALPGLRVGRLGTPSLCPVD